MLKNETVNNIPILVGLVLERLENRYKRYGTIVFIVFLLILILFPIVAYEFRRDKVEIKEIDIILIYASQSGIYFTLFLFFFICNSKPVRFLKYKRFVLFSLFPKRSNYIVPQDSILSSFKIFSSVFIYLGVCILPLIIIKVGSESIFLSMQEIAGFQLMFVLLTIIICFGIILLPNLIGLKVKNQKYIHIYWFNFIAYKLVSSPFLLYLFIPMFFISSLSLCLFPFATNENIVINLKYLFEVNTFSLMLSILGIWITITIAIVNDFLKDYNRIYRVFEELTTFQLHYSSTEKKHSKQLLIGFGNLGKIVIGLLVEDLFNKSTKQLKKPLAHFILIIDKESNIRIIPRSFIVIERNKEMFEELRTDTSSNFSFGFFNGHDIINVSHEDIKIPKDVAILGINGDGSNSSILRDVDILNSKFVINTSSDIDMGIKLKKILESAPLDMSRPTLISNVEDNTSYSFLESENLFPTFPIHTSQIEGAAIGCRLLMFYNKLVEEKYKEKRIIIAGKGKTIYYIIDTFRRNLRIFKKTESVKKLIEELFIIISDDQVISYESTTNETEVNKAFKKWNLIFSDGEMVSIDLYNRDATKFSNIKKVYEYSVNKASDASNIGHIFVATTIKQLNTLRITQHMRQLASSMCAHDISILVSTAYEIKDEIEKVVKLLPAFKNLSHSFPSEVNDIIVKKNAIIGSQIVSMASTATNNRNIYSSNLNEGIISGEIALCIVDKPYSYIDALMKISNLRPHILFDKMGLSIPTFYYSYSYPIRSYNKNFIDTFVLRADTFFSNSKNYKTDETRDNKLIKPCIETYHVNSSQTNRKDIKDILHEIMNGGSMKECGKYYQGCPISSSNELNKSGFDNFPEKEFEGKKDLAVVKIWADNDHVPGSLAVSIADFLMIGNQIHNNNQLGKSVLNIVYEYCSLCQLKERSISRLYSTVVKITEEVLEEINQLTLNRNIRAIKIKSSLDKSRNWTNYCKTLVNYLNTHCNTSGKLSYKFKEVRNTYLIIRSDIENNHEKTEFVDNHL